MGLINLPPEAGLPIITGMLVNLYATIAIIVVNPFARAQMLLIAIFNLIAHGLIAEGIIQHKSGMNFARITLIRIATAALTVFIVSQFLDDTNQSVATEANLVTAAPLVDVLKGWAIGLARLAIKIFIIVMAIMLLLESLKALGGIEYLHKYSRALTKALGLSDRAAVIWITAAVFGLLLGGAVIVEEAGRGVLTKEELEHLHISIGINHSMVEDPALFLVLGLNALWLWVPRLVAAAVVVHTCRAVEYLKRKTTAAAR